MHTYHVYVGVIHVRSMHVMCIACMVFARSADRLELLAASAGSAVAVDYNKTQWHKRIISNKLGD